MSTDYEIWQEFKKGNEEALSNIYFHNVNKLFRYGRRFTHDRELIKDTIQDLFYDLIKSSRTVSTTDNIEFYLLKSFRHLLFRTIKKSNRINFISDNYENCNEMTSSSEDDILSFEEFERKEKLLNSSLKKLSARQREILYYKFTCGFDYDQICEIMSIKYDSACKLVFRAIQSLKEKIPDKTLYLLLLASYFASDF